MLPLLSTLMFLAIGWMAVASLLDLLDRHGMRIGSALRGEMPISLDMPPLTVAARRSPRLSAPAMPAPDRQRAAA